MPTHHAISASVEDALTQAIINEDVEVLADAFVEMYVLAQMGVGLKSYAAGVDDIAIKILTRQTGQ